ncbi:MAG: RNA polymerase factor sigma-54 [Armatimonadetes bacterium]|nr:RNA polymerase factor sigma-54 [Armatimonadota bacterium]MBS1729106.1 RNA polymerase factor sigma-54 [Armatimonadota bacterium]
MGGHLNIGYRNSQRLETGLRVDPKLLLASQILQLTQQELEQMIQTELNENPALERIAPEEEPMTDRMIEKSVAGRDLKPRGDDRELWRSLPTDDDTPSWIELAPSDVTLGDHVSGQLLPNLPSALRGVGEYVVGCLNDNGYLYEPIEEIALGANCSIEEAEFVVGQLKKCEPAGVGASGIQESLLLQLRHVDTLEGKIARRIVRDHLDLFTNGKHMKLAKKFSVTPDVIDQVFDLILGCTPFPGESFQSSSATSEARLPAVQPDLVLIRSEQGWEVAVKGPVSIEFSLNGYYKKRLEELQEDRRKDKDERRHVAHFVERASNFIECLEQRYKTMMKIGQYLIEHQPGFISTGDATFLLPLTRTQLAHDIGLHESTISRATQGKFVQLATGETVSFDVFFKPALRIQKMIEEILATENPDNPLSDERIAQILASKGVQVARRTVNKYRDRTKLLSSRKRRTA